MAKIRNFAEIAPNLPFTECNFYEGPSWDQAKRILTFCLSERTLLEIMAELQMTSRNKFRVNYIIPLLNKDLLVRTQPDKPNSSKQRYIITAKGKEMLSQP